jgi:hypothetical protein
MHLGQIVRVVTFCSYRGSTPIPGPATEELSYCCMHVHMRVGLLVEIAVVREGLTYRML